MPEPWTGLATRRSLRLLLDEMLPFDSDLESFCIDHFIEVNRHFSGQMTRETKLSYLLGHVEPIRIVRALEQYEAFPRHMHLLREGPGRREGGYRFPGLQHFDEACADLFFG